MTQLTWGILRPGMIHQVGRTETYSSDLMRCHTLFELRLGRFLSFRKKKTEPPTFSDSTFSKCKRVSKLLTPKMSLISYNVVPYSQVRPAHDYSSGANAPTVLPVAGYRGHGCGSATRALLFLPKAMLCLLLKGYCAVPYALHVEPAP